MEEIVFIKQLNEPLFYDLYFSDDADAAWGENWNICPAALVGNLDIEKNYCTKAIRVKMPIKLFLASQNTCFSLQDCIDGIMPLAFSEPESDEMTIKNGPLILRFGEGIEDVLEKIRQYKGEILFEYPITDRSNEINDDLIDNLNV